MQEARKHLVRLTNRPINRVITIRTNDTSVLDRRTQELLDIIDAYGGTNPYPRLTESGIESLVYSCTTKIAQLNIEDFDKEVQEWRNKQ